MAGAQTRRDLYLQVSGSVDGLKGAMATGKSLITEFGNTSINVLEEVEREIAKVGTGGAPGLREMERGYTDTFRRIKANARAVIDAPTPSAALGILDANAARQAAEAATSNAAALRMVAEAASRADVATNGQSGATRQYAVAAATAAVEAEREAAALREQAAVLGTVEAQLGKHATAQARTTAVSGQARAGMQQLSYQLGDVATMYAGGASGAMIFATQSGQVIQAIGLMTGEAKGFLGFLGGPWGIALSAAAVAVTPLISKLIESGDEVGKETEQLRRNAEKADVAARAKEAFAHTEAGAIDSVRKLTEEIERQNEALRTNAERQNIRSRDALKTLEDARPKAVADLAQARADADAADLEARRNPEGGAVGAGMATQRLSEAEDRLRKLDADIIAARTAYQRSRADLADEAAQRATDPVAAIKFLYEGHDGLIEQAKRRAVAEGVVGVALTRQLTTLREQEAAAMKAAQAKSRGGGGGGGGENALGQTVATLRELFPGVRITATTNGRHVAGSDHYAGRGIDFVPAGGMGSMSYAQALAMVQDAGINVRRNARGTLQFFGPGHGPNGPGDHSHDNHFHLGFEGSVSPEQAAQRRDASARRAEAAENKRTQDADAYASLMSNLQEQQARAQRQRVMSIEEVANLDVQAVQRERDDAVRQAQKGTALGRWTQGEADAAIAVANNTALLETQAIRRREQLDLLDRQLEADRAASGRAMTLLQLQADLATTAKERQRLALQMLAQEEEMRRTEATAKVTRGLATGDDRLVQEGITEGDQVTAEHDMRVEKAKRGNGDRLDQYFDRIKSNSGDMNEALRNVEADGLQSLEDGLVGLIDGTESVGSAFKKMANAIIADLARIAIEKAIVAIIGGGFGFAAGGEVQAHATGGFITGPGTGKSDSILSWLSNGEFVVNAEATARHLPLLRAINDNQMPRYATGGPIGDLRYPMLPRTLAAGGQLQIVKVVTEKSDYFDTHVIGLTAPMAQAAVPAGAAQARQDAADEAWSRIPV